MIHLFPVQSWMFQNKVVNLKSLLSKMIRKIFKESKNMPRFLLSIIIIKNNNNENNYNIFRNGAFFFFFENSRKISEKN